MVSRFLRGQSVSQPQLDPTLLQPSLGEQDDAGGFDRPLNPHTIIIWSFFCGIVCGGLLFATNFRRLGWPRRFWPTLYGTLLLASTVYVVLVWGVQAGWFHELPRNVLRQFNRGVAIVAAIVLAQTQSRRYRLAIVTNTPLGSHWKLGIVCAFAGVGIELVIALLIQFLAS